MRNRSGAFGEGGERISAESNLIGKEKKAPKSKGELWEVCASYLVCPSD